MFRAGLHTKGGRGVQSPDLLHHIDRPVLIDSVTGALAVVAAGGRGHDGPVSMLFLETGRRKTPEVLRFVTETEPICFYIVDEVRLSSGRKVMFHAPAGWRAIF